MADLAAVLPAGLAGAWALLAMLGARPGRAAARPLAEVVGRVIGREAVRARAASLPGLSGGRLLGFEAFAAVSACLAVGSLTGMPALAAAAAALGAGTVVAAVEARILALRRRRQDAVLESVRVLRQLLQTGAVGVSAGLEILAARGPIPLRPAFAAIVGGGGRPAAWAAARAAVGEPLFDLLAAAVLVQRPGGGELGPLFGGLEEAVSGVHEVEREAAALQVQARSASTLILALPLAFLAFMCLLRSPYLDVYRTLPGQLFLAAMLVVMGAAHALIRRWLALPEDPRLELVDG